MGLKKLPPIGAMIETPAAALSIRSLVKHVDFLSIGSNDLTQYTLAAGRENALVNDYFIDDHPSIFRLMEIVIKDAETTPVSLCGELAGRISAIPELLRIGLRSLSVASSLLAEVRQTIRGTSVLGLPGNKRKQPRTK
jgi:phosphoenolpyruvate-protein kinase (PTS system EI component)